MRLRSPCTRKPLPRVLVDNGAAVNVLPASVMRKIGKQQYLNLVKSDRRLKEVQKRWVSRTDKAVVCWTGGQRPGKVSATSEPNGST